MKKIYIKKPGQQPEAIGEADDGMSDELIKTEAQRRFGADVEVGIEEIMVPKQKPTMKPLMLGQAAARGVDMLSQAAETANIPEQLGVTGAVSGQGITEPARPEPQLPEGVGMGTALKYGVPLAVGMALPVPAGAGLAGTALTYGLRGLLGAGGVMAGEQMQRPQATGQELAGKGAQELVTSIGTDVLLGQAAPFARQAGGAIADWVTRSAGVPAAIATGEKVKEAVSGEPAQMPGLGTLGVSTLLGAAGARMNRSYDIRAEDLAIARKAAVEALPAGTDETVIDAFAPLFAKGGSEVNFMLRNLLQTDSGRRVYAQAMQDANVAQKLVNEMDQSMQIRLQPMSAEEMATSLTETKAGLRTRAQQAGEQTFVEAERAAGIEGVQSLTDPEMRRVGARTQADIGGQARLLEAEAANIRADRERLITEIEVMQERAREAVKQDLNTTLRQTAERMVGESMDPAKLVGRDDALGQVVQQTASDKVREAELAAKAAWKTVGAELRGEVGQIPVMMKPLSATDLTDYRADIDMLRKGFDGQLEPLANKLERILFPEGRLVPGAGSLDPSRIAVPTFQEVAEATRALSDGIGAIKDSRLKGTLLAVSDRLMKAVKESVPPDVFNRFAQARNLTHQTYLGAEAVDEVLKKRPEEVWRDVYQVPVTSSTSPTIDAMRALEGTLTGPFEAQAVRSAFKDAWIRSTDEASGQTDIDRLVNELTRNKYTAGMVEPFKALMKQQQERMSKLMSAQAVERLGADARAGQMQAAEEAAQNAAKTMRGFMEGNLSKEMMDLNPTAFEFANRFARPMAHSVKTIILRNLIRESVDETGVFSIEKLMANKLVQKARMNPDLPRWFPELEALTRQDMLNGLAKTVDGAKQIRSMVEMFDKGVGKVGDLATLFLDNRNIRDPQSLDVLLNSVRSLPDGQQKLSALRTSWLKNLIMDPETNEVDPRLWRKALVGQNAYPDFVIEKLAGGKEQANALRKWIKVFDKVADVADLMGSKGWDAVRPSMEWRKMLEFLQAGAASSMLETVLTGNAMNQAKRSWLSMVVFKNIFGSASEAGIMEQLTAAGIEARRNRVYNQLATITKLGEQARRDLGNK